MRACTIWLLGMLLPLALSAQGYRLRIGTRFQSVAVRGVSIDSIPRDDVIVGGNGGLQTPDGIAVRCVPGLTNCTFFRPGPEQHGGPLVTTADFQLWGFGVPGLRFRGRSRIAANFGDADMWPNVDPTVQLLEGYAEYGTQHATVQLGRTHVTGRFGFTGFDGARLDVRSRGRSLTGTVFGGWGLARGVALPLTSPALNPLDDATPRRRQAVTGAAVAWSVSSFNTRILYEREWAGTNALLAERVGVETWASLGLGLSLNGGIDYDLAAGFWGTANGQLSFSSSGGSLAALIGVRRYRPHFDLWTIWGAFSPVPHTTVFTRASVTPVDGLRVFGRGEVYEFDDAEALTPLVTVEVDGWRWAVGATYDVTDVVTASADYHREMGPGAASNGLSGDIRMRPVPNLSFGGQAGVLERPLEFRFNDARLWMFGADFDYAPTPQLRLTASAVRYAETRRRPDAAAFDWNQYRVSIGVVWSIGSAIASGGLPPSVLRMPARRAEPR